MASISEQLKNIFSGSLAEKNAREQALYFTKPGSKSSIYDVPGGMSKETNIGMSYATPKPVTQPVTQTVTQPKTNLSVASVPKTPEITTPITTTPSSNDLRHQYVTMTGNMVTVYKNGKAREIDSALLPSFERAGFSTQPTTTNTATDTSGEETVSDIYGYFPGTDKSYEDALKAYGESLNPTEMTESEIQQAVIDRFQAQIDALNRYYAEQISKENIVGEGRLGSTASIQARRGLLGSDFGAAQTEKISQYNRDIIRSIEAEKEAMIQNILSEGRKDVVAEAKAKREAKQAGAKAYIEFLAGEQERKTNRLNAGIQNMIASGYEPTDEDYKEIASTYKVGVGEVKSAYAAAKKAATTVGETKEVNGILYQQQNDGTWKAVTPAPATDTLDIQHKQLQIQKLQQEINSSTNDIDKAIKQAQLTKLQQEISDATTTATQEPYKAQLATQGRQAVSELLKIAQADPSIFGRSAALPIPDALRSKNYRNYKALLDYLKGNIIPAALSAMREASKTGGALGQVSDNEGAWLASSLGALSMEQDPAQVVKQLQQVDASLARWQTAVDTYSGTDGEWSW